MPMERLLIVSLISVSHIRKIEKKIRWTKKIDKIILSICPLYVFTLFTKESKYIF